MQPSGEFFFLFSFWLLCAACGFLVPCPGIKPVPLAVEEWLANHCVPLCAQWLSRIQLLHIPMNCSLPASSVYGLSRQEYWSGLPFPPPGELPPPGSNPLPCVGDRFFTTEPPGKPASHHTAREFPRVHFLNVHLGYRHKYRKTLGWPKSSFGYFHAIVQKTQTKFFRQLNISLLLRKKKKCNDKLQSNIQPQGQD